MDVQEITAERVRQVLRHLSRDRTPGRTVLADLDEVGRALEAAGFYPTLAARQYEVGRMLTEIVDTELSSLRRRAGLPEVESAPGALIATDFSRGQRELESWSSVYHMYLRPDLDLSLRSFTGLLDDRHRRTVQRRLRRGVAALTTRLQDLERGTRQSLRQAQLTARLPGPSAPRLVGVDQLFRQLDDRLRDPHGSMVVALRGPGGIGKTALAHALARHSILRETFDDVAWIAAADGPMSTDASADGLLASIGRQLTADAASGAPAAELRAWLSRRRTLVVLDGLDEPERAAMALGALEVLGGASRALVTGRLGWSAWPSVQVLDVPALEPDAAVTLLRQEAANRGLDDVATAPDEALASVVAATRGHPLAIRLAAAQLRASDAAGVARCLEYGEGAAAVLCRELWHAPWQRAGSSARALVRVVIQHENSGQPADLLTLATDTGFAPAGLATALTEAVDLGLLEPGGTVRRRVYRPALFLRRYLLQAD